MARKKIEYISGVEDIKKIDINKKIDDIYKDIMITIEELNKRNPNTRNVYYQIKDKLPKIIELIGEL